MSNYNSQLQENNTDLQSILNTINELPAAGGSSGGSAFPYQVTLTTSGLSCSPIIYYGDDGNSIYILTGANGGGAYIISSVESVNCEIAHSGCDGIYAGDYFFFNNFTGDATIKITWSMSGGF